MYMLTITLAIVVGCLPSFAIFIRGRVIASRAYHDGSSSMNPSGYRSNPKSKDRTGHSTRSQSENQLWQLRDTASDKSLVEGGIIVTRSWSQKWQNPAGKNKANRETETGHELENVAV
jgi:hypothetical protein